MTRLGFASVLSAVALWVGAAQAAVIYDTSLVSPPGVFFGYGNINLHWTVDNEANGIQLGLQGLERYIGPYTPDSGSSVYHAATGPTTVPLKTGSAWDIAFSVNIGSSLSWNQVTTQLCLTDVGNGTYGCFDALAIPDNAISGNVAQNAEALSFSTIAGAFNDPGYDVNANDTYLFTLSLFNGGTSPVASVDATIVTGTGAPVPEPSSLIVLSTALFGVDLLRRRRARWTSLS